MRILLVMVEPPLPFGSAAARWFYVLLRGLVERGHQVTAFATCSQRADIEKAARLFPAPAYDLRCFETPPPRRGLGAKISTLRRPFSFMFSDAMHGAIEAEAARGYDVLHLEQMWAGWLGMARPERALLNVHHLVEIDLAQSQPSSWRERLQWRMMFSAEHRILRGMRWIRSCSPRLVPDMAALNPRARIETVPVGIDPAQYRFITDEARHATPVVSVIGSMNWHPTRSAARRFLERLWPEIKRQVPEARAQIVGWEAKSALADLLARPELLGDVTVEENVPDIQPYFDRTSVLLYAPARGSGMKIKVMEAMSFGVPVVTTEEGVEGLPARDGIEAGVAGDDAGLIDRAVRLLRDSAAQNRQRLAARRMIEAHCGPAPTLDAIERIYARMLEERAPERNA